jgi:hypothetical protein
MLGGFVGGRSRGYGRFLHAFTKRSSYWDKLSIIIHTMESETSPPVAVSISAPANRSKGMTLAVGCFHRTVP